MKGGHNRKSAAQRRAEGNPGKRAIGAESVVIAPGEPVKPPGMSEVASQLWDAYVPLLAQGGVLEQVDGLGLAQMFEAYVLATRSRDIVGDSPVMEVPSPYGDGRVDLKKHPGVTAWKDAIGVLRGLLSDYGLQPLARTRMGDAFVKPGDSFGPDLPDGAPAAWTPKVVGDEG